MSKLPRSFRTIISAWLNCYKLCAVRTFGQFLSDFSETKVNRTGTGQNAAIEYCIGHNILRDFLKKYQTEVLGMLLEEFVRQLFSKGLTAEDIAGLLDMPMEQINHVLH